MNDRYIIALGLFILLTTPLWIGFVEGFFGAVDIGGRFEEFGNKMNWAGQRLGWWITGQENPDE